MLSIPLQWHNIPHTEQGQVGLRLDCKRAMETEYFCFFKKTEMHLLNVIGGGGG